MTGLQGDLKKKFHAPVTADNRLQLFAATEFN
jgi:hypothetical protein